MAHLRHLRQPNPTVISSALHYILHCFLHQQYLFWGQVVGGAAHGEGSFPARQAELADSVVGQHQAARRVHVQALRLHRAVHHQALGICMYVSVYVCM